MRRPLRRSEVWTGVATGIATGVPFGLIMAVFGIVQDGSWAVSAVGGVVGGVLFGVGMGVFSARQRAALQAAVSGSDHEDRRTALLRFRLDTLERQKGWSTALYVVLVAVGVTAALRGATWQVVPAVIFAVLLAGSWVQRRRLRRALAAREADEPLR